MNINYKLNYGILNSFENDSKLNICFLETVKSEDGQTVLGLLSFMLANQPRLLLLKCHNKTDDETAPGPESPYYRKNRYNYFKSIQFSNKLTRFRNPDYLFQYQIKHNNIFFDVPLTSLPRNNSSGTSFWESYNWALISIDNNFHLIFARHDESRSAEFGLKHTMIALPHDLWACGEMRIIKNNYQWYYQFNLNSSINSTSSINQMKTIQKYRIKSHLYRKLMAHKLRQAFELYSREDENIIIQFVEELVHFDESVDIGEIAEIINPGSLYTLGITPNYQSIDPVYGLLYYYYEKDSNPNLSEDYINSLNKFCQDNDGESCYWSESTSTQEERKYS